MKRAAHILSRGNGVFGFFPTFSLAFVLLLSLAASSAQAVSVSSIAAQTVRSINLTYGGAMGSGVTTAANYTLSGAGMGSLNAHPDAVTLVSGNTYALTWTSGEMIQGGAITVTVANVTNLSNPKSKSATGIGTQPSVSTVNVVTGLTIDVTFSELMGTGVTTAANYTLSGTGRGSLNTAPNSVALVSGNTYRLTWTSGDMTAGGDITVAVNAAVQDDAGNVMSATRSGTDTGAGVVTPPTVTTVAVSAARTVDVTFSEAMGTGVTTAANYTISGAGRGNLASTPSSVSGIGGNVYRLTWTAGEMLNGQDVIITVANAKDSHGYTVGAPNSGTDTGGGIGVAPTVQSVTRQTALTIDVAFSEAMGSGVTTAANYTLSGTGKGSLAPNPDSVALQSGNTYRLTWDSGEMVQGGNLTVTVANAQDAIGNVIGSPNSATHTGGGLGVAPTVSGMNVTATNVIDVTFSEPMLAGVTTPSNYTLAGAGKGSMAANPTYADWLTGNTYRLIWTSGEMLNGSAITITCSSNIKDAAGNAIGSPNSASGVGYASIPYVTDVAVQTGLTIDVAFSDIMGAGVTTAANFILSGTGKGSLSASPSSVALVSGKTYRLTWASGEMVNGGDITITANMAIKDTGGNAMGTPNSATDSGGGIGTSPTVTTVAVSAARTVDVTFSEGVSAGVTTAANYTISGAGKGSLTANPNSVAVVSGNTYRLTWTAGEMVNNQDVTITVANVSDTAGNALGTPNSATDTAGGIGTAPSVSSVNTVTGLTIDVAFNEAMGSGVTTAANYTVSGAGKGSLAANPTSVAWQTGNTYRLTWASGEMVQGSNVTVTVANAQDAAGNVIGATNSGTDTGGGIGTAPTITSVVVQDHDTVDVTFSEAMGAGVTTTANYTLSGTGKGSLAAAPSAVVLLSGNTYRLTWSSGDMLNGGNITVAGSTTNIKDVAGNVLGSPSSATDTAGAIGTMPTVATVAVQTGLTIDVTFSEAMGTGVTTAANYTLSGTGKGNLNAAPNSVAVVSGNTYRLTWSSGEMIIGGDITVAVGSAVKDSAGNAMGTPSSGTDAAGGMGTAPTVTTVAVNTALTIDVTFSEAVSAGVSTASNYTLSGPGKGSLAANPNSVALVSGNKYRLTWTAGEMVNGQSVTVTVANVKDTVGNSMGTPNSGTHASGGIGTAPSVSSVNTVTALTIDVAFSEAMGAGVTTAANYTLSGTGKGSLAANPTSVAWQTGNTYRLTWTSGEMIQGSNVTVTVANAQDAAGNVIGATNSGTDTGGGIGTVPTVSAVSVLNGTTVDVTFSEAMGSGITTAANYTLSGTGKGSLAANPASAVLLSGNTYRLTWSSGEMINGGDITVAGNTTNIKDVAGNALGAPSSGTDTAGGIGIPPTVTGVVVQTGLTVDVTFTEAMGSGVTTAANYAISGAGKGSLNASPNSVAVVSGNTYRLTWTSGEMVAGGDVTITAGSAVKDTAGNVVGTPSSATHTGGGKGTAPTVTSVNVNSGLTIDVAFSEAMGTGVTTAANYTVSGAGKGSLAANPTSVAWQTGNTYRLTWASGEMVNNQNVTVTVANVKDSAGNVVGTPNSGTDTNGGIGAAPTVSSINTQTAQTIDVVFSEAMGAGVTTAANYTLSGAGKGTLAANPSSVALVSGSTYRLTWASGEMLQGSDVTVTVANAQDAAGNGIGSPNAKTETGGGIGTLPTVTSVSVQSASTIDITFSETMGAGVTTAANYTLSGTGKGTLAVNPASAVLVSGNTYRLTWSTGDMFNGGNITVTGTSSIKDSAGNALGSPNSGTHTNGAIGTIPTVISVVVQTISTIDVTFSETMGTGVTTAANYVVSGSGKGSLSNSPASVALVSGSTYRLTWSAGGMVTGGDVTITASGVADAAANALGSPNSGTHVGGGKGVVAVVSTVAVQSALTIDVTFNTAMGTGVTTAGNYTVSGAGKGTFASNPNSVALVSGNTYRLSWTTGEMIGGSDVTITVANVKDALGGAIGTPNSGTDVAGGIGTIPYVQSVDVQSGLTILVTFSEPIASGATTAANYTISGDNGTLASHPASVSTVSSTSYLLTWTSGEMINGGDITVAAANIRDSVGNLIGSPNSGTDSNGGIGTVPTVSSVKVQTGRTVDITYSEPMGGFWVLMPFCYSVAGSGKGNLGSMPNSVALVSGSTYRLTWTSGEMFNGGDIKVTAISFLPSFITDAAGNNLSTPDNGTDVGGAIGTLPALTSAVVQSGLQVNVTFSEAVNTGMLTAANYTISGTGKGSLADHPASVALVSGNTYSLTWSTGEMVKAGDVTITPTGIKDGVGNPCAVPGSATHVGGGIGTQPTMSSIAINSPLAIDVAFSEAMGPSVTTAANYTLSGSGKGALAANPSSVALVSGNTYRLTWASGEMFIGGDITVTASTGAKDVAGNGVGSPNSRTLAAAGVGTLPTVAMSSTASNPTNVSPIVVTVDFNEAVSGFTTANVVATNATASNLVTVSPTRYTFDLVPAGQGSVTASIAAAAIHDSAGNANTTGASISRAYDGTKPGVTISSTAPDSTSVSPIPVTVDFTESVSGFTAAQVVLGNATASNFVSVSGTRYTFDVVPTGQGLVTVDVPQGSGHDSAGNQNTAATQLSRTYDSVKPTLVLSSAEANPTSGSLISVTATFSEAVSGFAQSNIVASNATVGNFRTVSTSVYTFDLSPLGQGTVTADVAANAASDSAGNQSAAAAQFSRVRDTDRPTAALGCTSPNPTNSALMAVGVKFSEPVKGFTAAMVAVGNATIQDFTAVSQTDYSFNLAATGQGAVTAQIGADACRDLAGNACVQSAQLSRTYDSVAPSLVINSTATDPTNVASIPVTVVLDEPVTDLAPSDVVTTNATVTSFAGSGSSYSFNLIPAGQGYVAAGIAAGAAHDAAGNPTQARLFSRTYDTVKPTVSMTTTASDPTTQSIPVTVTFSEPVTGFTASDITAGNASVQDFQSLSGTQYSFTLSPMWFGAITADIAAGVAQDGAGNANTAATRISRNYKSTYPLVSMTTTLPDPTNHSPIPVVVHFTDEVTGFEQSDVVPGNATVNNFRAVSTSEYSFDLLPKTNGAVTADIAAGVARNAGGFDNTAAPTLRRTYDDVRPGVTINSTAPNPTNAKIPVVVEFSEPITMDAPAPFSAYNATIENLRALSSSQYAMDLAPRNQGMVMLDVAANVAHDAAGNKSTGAIRLTRAFDDIAPTVSMTSFAPEFTTGTVGVIVRFSEPVVEFEESDVDVRNATISNFSGTGNLYVFTLTPVTEGPVMASIAANAAHDEAGNTNSNAEMLSRTFERNARPHVVSMVRVNDSPAKGDTVNYTVTFNEDVTGFEDGDCTINLTGVTGTPVSHVTGGPSVYNVAITGFHGDGTLNIQLVPDVCQNAAGTGNRASDRSPDYLLGNASLNAVQGWDMYK